jgi:hypothetical protein
MAARFMIGFARFKSIPCEHGGAIIPRGGVVAAVLSGRRGADLLDALLSEVVAFSNSPNNQDDITLLALDLAEPAVVDDGVPGV